MTALALEVSDLQKTYTPRGRPPVRALDGISFTVPSGSIIGLLGPNGAGKTTTVKILTTLLLPGGGSARVMGYDVVRNPLEVRRNICVVLQENAVELYLSVRDNLRTFGRFQLMEPGEIERRADRVLEQFGLKDIQRQKAIDLSGGMKRRLQVAKVFMVDKPVVFLDEATTGMDTLNKRATIRAIREETRRGRTVVLTTHVLDEAEEMCDALVIINKGKIVAQGSVEHVKALGLRLMHVSLVFEKLERGVIAQLKRLKPVKMQVRNMTVELTLPDRRGVMNALAALRRNRYLVEFEVSGATLEDVFVELLDPKEGEAS